MLEHMRSNQVIDEQGTSKEKGKPKSVLIDPNTPAEEKKEGDDEEKAPSNEMESAPGFGGTRLTQ